MAKVTVTAADRSKVADFAYKLVTKGVHFLNGAQGAIPGSEDGPLNRFVSVAPLSLKASSPMVYAAKHGRSTCMGRYSAVDGRVLTTEDNADLEAYLRDQESIELLYGPSHILPFSTTTTLGKDHHLTPRRVGRRNILGELCLGKRHCDCIGFVNFCFSKVLGRPDWHYSFQGYKSTFDSVSIRDLEPGDVVIRLEVWGTDEDGKAIRLRLGHSGICYEHPGRGLRVLNNAAGNAGALSSPFKESRWPDARVRVTSYWT